jgi:hypothetical protein
MRWSSYLSGGALSASAQESVRCACESPNGFWRVAANSDTALASQGGFTADLLLPLRFGVSELRETGRPGGQLAAKRPNSNGRCKQRPTAIYRRYGVDDLISGSVDVNPRFCSRLLEGRCLQRPEQSGGVVANPHQQP